MTNTIFTSAPGPREPELVASKPTAAPLLAVIVPTFNERDNIALLHHNLALALEGVAWELIVVDDNSPDGTADAVRTLAQHHANVRCLKRIGRRGLSSACIEGILSSAAVYVAVMDADHQHDERILPQMLARAEAGADLVVGSRFTGSGSAQDGLSAARFWGSRVATRLSTMVTGQALSDPMSGFFLLRRKTFEHVAPKLSSDGFKILLDLIITSARTGIGLDIAEIPYQFRARHAGQSKMSPLVALQFLGLWLSKLTNGVVPTSFLLFALVGLSGLSVHLGVLAVMSLAFQAQFLIAQIVATLVAMTWNFFLNNILTYADRRLRGKRLWLGLLGFYVICSVGGIANISIAQLVYEVRHAPFIAGLAGALMSSVFNYAVTRIFTWR